MTTKQLTGKELIERLAKVNQGKPVYFSGISQIDNCPVNHFYSWRGSYSEPSIGSCGNTVYTAKELVVKLVEFFNSTQTGWKGGEFKMNELCEVWCDYRGDIDYIGASGVTELEDCIFINTANFDPVRNYLYEF